MLSLLFLIPLLPFAGALINGLFGSRMRSERVVSVIACGSVLLAFLLSLGCVLQLGTGLEAFAEDPPAAVTAVDVEGRRVELTVARWVTSTSA